MYIGEVYYELSNRQLVKELGLTFYLKLNFNQHIYEMTHRATNALSMLKRTFIFLDRKTFLLLYKFMI